MKSEGNLEMNPQAHEFKVQIGHEEELAAVAVPGGGEADDRPIGESSRR